MTDLQSLLSRIEAASGPDEPLDHAILLALGARYELDWGPEYYWPDGERFYAHRLTASIDDAVALVEKMLPDHRPSVYQLQSGKWEAEVAYPKPRRHQFQGTTLATVSPNPAANGALALCSALLSELIESRKPAPVNSGTPDTDTPKGEQHKTPPQQPRDPKSENRGAGE